VKPDALNLSFSPAPRADFYLLLGNRVTRAFAFGFAGILLGLHLQSRNLTPAEIGFVLALGFATASLTGLLAAIVSKRLGRRLTLTAIGVLMALSGADLAFATQPWQLVMAGLTGMIGAAGTDLGPFLPIEQSLLVEVTDVARRNRAFARYSLSGAVAASVGGVAAGFGSDLLRTQVFFLVFAILGLTTAVLPLFLSTETERGREGPAFGHLRPILRLSSLFAIDSFAGGLVVNAVIVYWLHIRFGASPALLGPCFAAMSLLSAMSFEISGRLADRFGLINTMVFTHLPSNLLLLSVPFVPWLGIALAVLLVRSAITSMDVPARQAYVVSIVAPSERSGAIAITGAVRGLAGGFGPLITGASIGSAAMWVPFILGGAMKSVYDVALFYAYSQRFPVGNIGKRQ
jgi:MFS family permease